MAKLKVKSGNFQVIWLCFLFFYVGRVACNEEDDLIWPASCGLRNTGGLVMNGEDSKPDWPWVAVLCHGSGTADCFCSANVITQRYIITAAHCFYSKEADKFFWSNVTVLFGKHNLLDNSEDSQSRSIIDVVIHPDWKTKTTGTAGESYDADIAIFRLSEPVTFNDRVKPICLPSTDELNDVNGTVVSKVLTAQ